MDSCRRAQTRKPTVSFVDVSVPSDRLSNFFRNKFLETWDLFQHGSEGPTLFIPDSGTSCVVLSSLYVIVYSFCVSLLSF